MIKIVCLGVCAASMVVLYKMPVPDAELARAARVRSQDRLFLADLGEREVPNARVGECTDQTFLAGLQQSEPGADATRVAKAVAIRRPQSSGVKATVAEEGLPVRRAIAVEQAAPSAMARVVDSGAGTGKPTVTKMGPAGIETPRTKGRASILIYRGEMIVRPAVP